MNINKSLKQKNQYLPARQTADNSKNKFNANQSNGMNKLKANQQKQNLKEESIQSSLYHSNQQTQAQSFQNTYRAAQRENKLQSDENKISKSLQSSPRKLFLQLNYSHLMAERNKNRVDNCEEFNQLISEKKIITDLLLQQQDRQFKSLYQKIKQHDNRRTFNEKDLEKKPFVNPRRFDEKKRSQSSQMYRSFMCNYIGQFQSEDGELQQKDKDNMLNKVLINQLNATAMNSHKWSCKASQQRMIQQVSDCPDFPNYPFEPETVQEIKKIKEKQSFNRVRQNKVNKEFEYDYDQMLNSFILDTSQQKQDYLKTLEKLVQCKQIIFKQKMEDYQEMIDYSKLNKSTSPEQKIKEVLDQINFIKYKAAELNEERERMEDEKKIKIQEEEMNNAQKRQQNNKQYFAPHYFDKFKHKRSLTMNRMQHAANQKKEKQQTKESEVDQLKYGYLQFQENDVFVTKPKKVPRSNLIVQRYISKN
eukprot:TRINITY_DN9224_c0_g1_i4.p1 TRINITY_DN9224_c0_g1~~TRINITY_DN9224_c0_g1_i4.p1  ORF type:complete len:476 (+),score=102.36 TRINITY_DN9224_c0_g1_i4:31-1458(+)